LRYPGHAAGLEKLYAALIFQGTEHIRSGEGPQGIAQFVRARDLLPERPEAPAALRALTPTPTPAPRTVPVAPPAQRQSAPAPRPAVQQPAPQQAAPPTRPPFSTPTPVSRP
jgi:hypothetical protein